MELSGSNIKKCLIFLETVTLKNFLYFRKKLSSLKNEKFRRKPRKNLLNFLKRKLFFIFGEMEIPKKFRIFQETELSYISGNFLYFRK